MVLEVMEEVDIKDLIQEEETGIITTSEVLLVDLTMDFLVLVASITIMAEVVSTQEVLERILLRALVLLAKSASGLITQHLSVETGSTGILFQIFQLQLQITSLISIKDQEQPS